jgi:hypothetical protein
LYNIVIYKNQGDSGRPGQRSHTPYTLKWHSNELVQLQKNCTEVEEILRTTAESSNIAIWKEEYRRNHEK